MLRKLLKMLRRQPEAAPAPPRDPRVQALAEFRGISYEEAAKQMQIDEVERVILEPDAEPLADGQVPMFTMSERKMTGKE